MNFCFKWGEKQLLKVAEYVAKWIKNQKKQGPATFSQSSTINLLHNCYLQFGNKKFNQVIGVLLEQGSTMFVKIFFSLLY